MKIRGRQFPNYAELETIYEYLKTKPNTVGFYVGKKRKNNLATAKTCIVCAVKEKVRDKDLRPTERIPKKISWLKQMKKPATLFTDVLTTKGFKLQTDVVYGPGDRIIGNARNKASVGMVLEHPRFGHVLTTAAHLFSAGLIGDKVSIESGTQTIIGNVVSKNSIYDYALISPSPDSVKSANLFRAIYALGGVYIVQQSDLDRKREMRVLAASGIRDVNCEGFHGVFYHKFGILRDTILTSKGTIPGDSGACLVTTDYAICGLVIGADYQFSYYTPASYAIFNENANLA